MKKKTFMEKSPERKEIKGGKWGNKKVKFCFWSLLKDLEAFVRKPWKSVFLDFFFFCSNWKLNWLQFKFPTHVFKTKKDVRLILESTARKGGEAIWMPVGEFSSCFINLCVTGGIK